MYSYRADGYQSPEYVRIVASMPDNFDLAPELRKLRHSYGEEYLKNRRPIFASLCDSKYERNEGAEKGSFLYTPGMINELFDIEVDIGPKKKPLIYMGISDSNSPLPFDERPRQGGSYQISGVLSGVPNFLYPLLTERFLLKFTNEFSSIGLNNHPVGWYYSTNGLFPCICMPGHVLTTDYEKEYYKKVGYDKVKLNVNLFIAGNLRNEIDDINPNHTSERFGLEFEKSQRRTLSISFGVH